MFLGFATPLQLAVVYLETLAEAQGKEGDAAVDLISLFHLSFV